MLSSFRSRFGIPGVISVIALVFAMFGGAYAASNSGDGATASAKKNSKAKKGAKGPRGPKGATGPAGPAGAKGDKGDTGAAGANGANGSDGAAGTAGAAGAAGANGKTVLNGTAVPTVAVGTIGDFYIETDVSLIYGPKAASGANGGWGAGTSLKGADGADGDDGADGSPWTVGGTLPSGKTETGVWSFTETDNGVTVLVPISFPIPLATQTGVGIDIAPDPDCPGVVTNPQASAGHLCVYKGELFGSQFYDGLFGPEPVVPPQTAFASGLGQSGASLKFQTTAANAHGTGSWAVTAP